MGAAASAGAAGKAWSDATLNKRNEIGGSGSRSRSRNENQQENILGRGRHHVSEEKKAAKGKGIDKKKRELDRLSSGILFAFDKEEESEKEKEKEKEERLAQEASEVFDGKDKVNIQRQDDTNHQSSHLSSRKQISGTTTTIVDEPRGGGASGSALLEGLEGVVPFVGTERRDRGGGGNGVASASTSEGGLPSTSASRQGDTEALVALESSIRRARQLVFSTHKSEGHDHFKGIQQCLVDSREALDAFNKRRETRALCDAIKLHVLACLWHNVYANVKNGVSVGGGKGKSSVTLAHSLAESTLQLLESNLSLHLHGNGNGSGVGEHTILGSRWNSSSSPVAKYVRLLREGMNLEEACASSVFGSIQRSIECFNLQVEKATSPMKAAGSWSANSGVTSALSSVVMEHRLAELVRHAKEDLKALQLEKELTRAIGQVRTSQMDKLSAVAAASSNTNNGDDAGTPSVKRERGGRGKEGMSLRSLQDLLSRGEKILSSHFKTFDSDSVASLDVDVLPQHRHRNVLARRLRRLLSIGVAVLRCRCSLERRGLRNKYEWPGFWLENGDEHFQALRSSETDLRNAMWDLLGIPVNCKRAVLECGREVFEVIQEQYQEQLRWDVEKLEEALAFEKVDDSVFDFEPYRSKHLRAAFVESAATTIQTIFRAWIARRDVSKVLARQRERLKKIVDDSSAIIIQRHARAWLSKRRINRMRTREEEDDRASVQRFTTIPPSRLIKALLEEMEQSNVDLRKQKGKVWSTRNTPLELATLVIKTSPTKEICWAMEQVPRSEPCAYLLETVPSSLAVAVLGGIKRKSFSVEILMLLQGQTQARVLREMQHQVRDLLFAAMKPSETVVLTAAFAHSDEYHSLSMQMLETAFSLGKLQQVGLYWARDRTRMANPSSSTARLVEYLKPYSMLRFTLGIKGLLQDEQMYEEMFKEVTKDTKMLVDLLCSLCDKHGSDIFPLSDSPSSEAFDYVKGLNILLHGLRCNGFSTHALAALTRLLDEEEVPQFHQEAISVLVRQMVHTLPLEEVCRLITWLSKHHTLDVSTVLHAIYQHDTEFCSKVLQKVDPVNLSKSLTKSSPTFAAMILLTAQDPVTADHLLSGIVSASPKFAMKVSEAVAKFKKGFKK